jgi:hypothetical protein
MLATVKDALLNRLDDVAATAAGALDSACQPHVFDRLSWLSLMWTKGGAHAPFVAHARLGDHSAWLYLDSIGNGRLRALSNWYSLVFRPVYAGGSAGASTPDVRALLLQSLANRLKPQAHQIDLAPLNITDADALTAAFGAAGWHIRKRPETGHWHMHVPRPDFDTYWKNRPARLRNTLARKQTRHPLDIEIHKTLTETLWHDFTSVYAASWKLVEGRPDFLRAFVEIAGFEGALRLGIARADGRPIAAQIWTVDQGRAIIHKLAYRADAANASPGTQLSHALFRHVLDQDQVTFISYGTGDDAYKRDWVDQREQLWRLMLINPDTPIGQIKIIAHRARDWLQQRRIRKKP